MGAWDGREYRHTTRRLLLFEPQAEAFAQLERNLGALPNVELVNAAVGASEGEAQMFTAHPSHSSSLLRPARDTRGNISFGGEERVAVTTLDQAVGGGFDTLRIDTQGYELEVLRGGPRTLARLERVEVEVHDPQAYPGAASLESITDFLAQFGFVLESFDVEGSDDLGDAVYVKGGGNGE